VVNPAAWAEDVNLDANRRDGRFGRCAIHESSLPHQFECIQRPGITDDDGRMDRIFHVTPPVMHAQLIPLCQKP
jgi:hypothetical protein